ncbi:YybH family protein [Archangium lansingense]|uniref:Nuclear transport factor 2 family protein n=1 Tax=Archangium lansingense TaxID=2995310 RepID=A0ABT4A0U3_9BACT|nr:nuclear transport factor 2 family protein [Archangium lansinium]MCY1074602.1 nuclear transport factor 2 family protein [Archangium lansinium]
MRTMQFVIALVLVLGFHGISQASEPCCEQDRTHSGTHQGRRDEAAILQAVQDFAEGSIRRDMRMLMGLWDARAADEVSFIQVENELPVRGLENFRAYYEGFLAHLIILSGEVSDVQIQRFGDMAYVLCRYHWVVKSVAGGPEMYQPTRATLVLRKQGQHWRYLHLHESITYQPKADTAP